MWLFSVLWFIVLMTCFFKNKKFVFYAILFLFSLLIGFRSETVGADTYVYADIYEMIGQNGYEGYPEPLYGYFNYVCYQLGLQFNVMQWIVSCIMLFLFANVIVKNSPNRNSSLFFLFSLFFIFYSMNVTRQMLAVSVVLYGYYLLDLEKVKGFILCMVIAATCHLSALVAFSILLIRNVKLNSFYFYLLLIFSFVIGTFFFDGNIFRIIAGPYAKFFVESDAGIRTGDRIFYAILLILFWNILCIFIYKTAKKEKLDTLWFKIYLFGLLINNMTYRLELGLRIVFYFSIVQIIFFPIYLSNNREREKLFIWGVLLMFVGIFFFVFLSNGSAGVLPYSNLLFDELCK